MKVTVQFNVSARCIGPIALYNWCVVDNTDDRTVHTILLRCPTMPDADAALHDYVTLRDSLTFFPRSMFRSKFYAQSTLPRRR